jgi:hypothetical protein
MNMRAAKAGIRQRRIQEQVATADKKHPKEEAKKAMQAGAREYPAPPFPKQHQSKPGKEQVLDPAPLFDGPFYRGSRKLENKIALITGGDSGIGRAVAILFAREGAHVAVYVFLASPQCSSYITGEILPIIGGYSGG